MGSEFTRSEFSQALIVLWCSVTYWLGGQELPYIRKGFKQIRRFAMPFGLCAVLIWLGAIWWKAILACLGLCVALHIGYQSSLVKYALTGALMALPSLVLGVSWAICLPLVAHLGFGYASLKDNEFKWAFVALIQGAAIGICYLLAL